MQSHIMCAFPSFRTLPVTLNRPSFCLSWNHKSCSRLLIRGAGVGAGRSGDGWRRSNRPGNQYGRRPADPWPPHLAPPAPHTRARPPPPPANLTLLFASFLMTISMLLTDYAYTALISSYYFSGLLRKIIVINSQCFTSLLVAYRQLIHKTKRAR